jgi:lipopolysaccharide/colanic/teichoic acid biosynthesis glycosyltransferase
MLKRLFDIIFSFIGIVILFPAFVVISLVIKLSSPGPVFFKGTRAGKNGKLFKMCKFRTMVENAEAIGGADTADDDPRLTKFGKFLRKYKIDEFPQLINVLKGEMSFVGPRPEIAWKVERYTLEEKKILDVSPGMTDYASLVFPDEGEILRGSLDPEKTYNEKIRPEKIRLELEYVKNHSFFEDIKTILKTLKAVFLKRK